MFQIPLSSPSLDSATIPICIFCRVQLSQLPKAAEMKLHLALGALCLIASVLAKDDKKDGKDEVGTVIGIDLGTTYSW